jgi:hypothetical protein
MGDNYSRSDDPESLLKASVSYFSASFGYHLIKDDKAAALVEQKGNRAIDRFAEASGITREKALERVADAITDDLEGSVAEIKRRSRNPLSAFIGVAGILGGLFFTSANITGHVISLTTTYSNWMGAVLFIVGLVGLGIYFRAK